MEDQRDIFEQK